ncbi:MAG: ATP-dependent helicase [Candidatus Pacearchaeota archaeon]
MEEKLIRESMDFLVREWFFNRFKELSLTQKKSYMSIAERKNTLISAPTGGTKTLSAFLYIINYLITLAKKNELEEKIYVIYCSPLKALTNDIYVNLINPLKEIRKIAEERGISCQEIRIGVRTGDSSLKERKEHVKKTPHILLTTPESLAILLNSRLSEKLKGTEFIIIDEIHSLAENKRGVHLSLTLERIEEELETKLTRIGLSATISPLEEIAKFLAGHERECVIVDVPLEKKFDLSIVSPYEIDERGNLIEKKEEALDEIIRSHKTTLIFTNTRSATERVVKNLKEKFPGKYITNIGAHHSSMSKEHRREIEEKLRRGELKAVVSSTSLELGIDIGYIDVVVLLGSPKSVSRALQRVGRAGHKLHETAKGIFFVYDFDDLVECSIMIKNSKEKKIDRVNIPKNCLDVLAQQILGMVLKKEYLIDELFKIIRKSYCYKDLSREDFYSVISYLAGEYNLENNKVYPKIKVEGNSLKKVGKLTKMIYLTNVGTIPDESYVEVLTRDKKEVGKIDEAFLEKLKKGDVFSLGGKSYEFRYTRGMKVYVDLSSKSPNIPYWYSEILPLSFTTAESIQKFRYLLKEKMEKEKEKDKIIRFIEDYCHIDKKSAELILRYFEEQKKVSIIPTEKEILIEHFFEEKNFFVFHCVYGRRINEALSRVVSYSLAKEKKKDLEIGVNDNGFYLSSKFLDYDSIEKALKKIRKENIREIIEKSLENSEILKRRFRHCAVRGLMILRNYKGKKKSAGVQQVSSHFLLSSIKKLTNEFPIYREAKREIIEDYMDLKNLEMIIEKIEKGEIRIIKKDIKMASPFAFNIINQTHKDFIKVETKQEFIKRLLKENEV